MDYSNKLRKNYRFAFLLIILFLVMCFPLYCHADFEDVEYQIVNGIFASINSNHFTSNSNAYLGVVNIEKGYVYNFSKLTGSNDIVIVSTSSQPKINDTYEVLTSLSTGNNYSYLAQNDGTLYLSFNTTSNGSSVSVTREKVPGIDGAINDLVDNVGVNSFWNIFDISINYIVVVVLVAFGIFIIFKLIRRLSKGKSGGI